MRAQTLARTFSVLQKAAAKPKGEKKPKAKATPKVGGWFKPLCTGCGDGVRWVWSTAGVLQE